MQFFVAVDDRPQPLAQPRCLSVRPSAGTVSSDSARMFVSVDNVPMGRVINRKFIFTPSGIDRYSVDNRALADMVINNA